VKNDPVNSTLVSLSDIRSGVEGILHDPDRIRIVSTRLMLRTGVNLGNIDPEQDLNPVLIERALDALAGMGYSLARFKPEARGGP
jgi:hypothetical protein